MKNGLTKTYCVKFVKDKWKICNDMTGLFGLSYTEAQKIRSEERRVGKEC